MSSLSGEQRHVRIGIYQIKHTNEMGFYCPYTGSIMLISLINDWKIYKTADSKIYLHKNI